MMQSDVSYALATGVQGAAQNRNLALFSALRSHRESHALGKIVKLHAACRQDRNAAMCARHDNAGQSIFVEALAPIDIFVA